MSITGSLFYFFSVSCEHHGLHILTPSVPTRRSSVLIAACGGCLTVDPRVPVEIAAGLRRMVTDDGLVVRLRAGGFGPAQQTRDRSPDPCRRARQIGRAHV